MANLTFLPLDLTGQALVNRRTNERHTLITVPNKTNRVCVLSHGAFYTRNLIVRDATTRQLIPGTDFKTTYHYDELSKLTAKEVMGLIVVTNTAVQSPLTVQYQAVGGHFSISIVEMQALLTAVDEDNLDLTWDGIVGKPTAYVPENHTHEYWQTWGWESTVTELDRIGAAWKAGTKAIVAENDSYGDLYVQKGRDALNAYSTKVTQHLADTANPHATDKNKVQLSNINNWSMATDPQVLDRNDAAHYMPIGGMYKILNTGPLPDLNNHIRNQSNPHQTTAFMAGCWTIAEVNQKLSVKYQLYDAAVDAALFGGRNSIQMRNDVTLNLSSSDITFGGFPHFQTGIDTYGIGYDVWNYALCGDGYWRKWVDLIAPYNVGRRKYVSLGNYTSAANLLAIANSVFAGWPDNTAAIGTIVSNPTPDVIYTTIKILVKSNGVWVSAYG